MKKLTKIFLTLVLVLVVFLCFGCKGKKSNLRENPELANGSDVYYTLTEGDKTYKVTNNEMYISLKKEYSANALVDLVDAYILGQEKDANGKTYLELANNETEIKALIDKDVYGEDELTDEEKAANEKDFLETMFINYGINATSIYADEIKARYQVILAQKLFATNKLNSEYAEHMAKYADESNTDITSPYFTENKYANLYNKENAGSYKVIIVPFTTEILAKAAAEKVGALTTKENFIDLYKLVYGYKYTDETDFELAAEDINSSVLAKIDEMEDGEYTAEPYVLDDGKLFVYIYVISVTAGSKFEDLSDEDKKAITKDDSTYTKELLEETLTSTYIATKLAYLRASYELTIYDDVVEALYVSLVKSYYTFTESTEEKNIVASVKGKEFTCEDLFKAMEKTSKAPVLVDILVKKRFLAGLTYTDEQEKNYQEALKEEKENFNNGTYVEYGYDPKLVTWKTFLEGSYGVVGDEGFVELKKSQDALTDYAAKLNPLEQYTKDDEGNYNFSATEEHAYWQLLTTAWNKQIEEFYSVKGIHVLVSLYEDDFGYANDGEKIPANEEGKWTEAQIAGAKELLEKVSAYLKSAKGTYAEKLDKFVLAYACAPKFSSTTYSALCTFTYNDGANDVNIDLSTYKALGLNIIWQDLGTFANGSMVEEFDSVAKIIWNHTQGLEGDVIATLSDADATYEGIAYSTKDDAIYANGIATKYGYHLFVETKANALSVAEESTDSETGIVTKRYLPTLAEIQDKVAGKTVTSSVSTAISKYYANYQSELKGSYFTSISCYNEISKLLPEADKAVKDFLDLYIDYVCENNLKYVTKDFLK